MSSTERRYDVDWVRIIGMAAVFTFHNLMYFNTWSWHAKNAVTTAAVQPLNLVFLIWIMPVFFAISGFATSQALTRRSPRTFASERLLRLGVPILVGAFLLSPFQVYSERVTYGQLSGSFLGFLPRYFHGWYGVTPDGNFAWMGLHLWFLLVLLIFSLVTLPFFARSVASKRPAIIGQTLEGTGLSGIIALIPLLIWLLEGLLFFLGLSAGQSGWQYGAYLGYYVIGFSVLPGELFRAAARKYRLPAFIGLLTTTGLVALCPEPGAFGLAFVGFHLAKVCACWFWIICLFAFADHYLNRNSPALQYWNEAVMPFYVLHQPVIVGLGFAIRNVPLSLPLKFALLYGCSLAITVGVYHFVVRPVNALRFLVGMRPRRLVAATDQRRIAVIEQEGRSR